MQSTAAEEIASNVKEWVNDKVEQYGGRGDNLVRAANSIIGNAVTDYRNDYAPIPCNCCGFSTVSCCKFWSIFNFIQIVPWWAYVCIKSGGYVLEAEPEAGKNLAVCLDGGTPRAYDARLAVQIILLIFYTTGSIIFIVANFQTEKAVKLRLRFTNIFIWTLVAFALSVLVSWTFHMFIPECHNMLTSLLAWLLKIGELTICALMIYFSYRVIKIFKKYLRSSSLSYALANQIESI